MHLFADATLARRLEALAADEMLRFVETARRVDSRSDAEFIRVGGGVAAYLGHESPVNQAVAVGMSHTVSIDEVLALESFYSEHGQRALVVASPLADHSLFTALSSRRWTVEGFENVLIREYGPFERFAESTGVEVVEVDDDESRALWAHIAAIGFSAPLEPTPSQLELARIVAARSGTRLMLAKVGGRPVGTGELYVDNGVAWLSADTTLPQFRKRGVQQALQLARLAVGAQEGCEMAVSEAIPGSGSQRNMERLGFRIAYTRADFVAPLKPLDLS